MLPRLGRLLSPLALVALVAGCAQVMDRGKSPLARPTMSPDSVALEIFFVRVRFGDEQANGALWEEIDEQRFDTALRRRLAESGFRLGLVPTQVPVPLQQLLQVSGQPVSPEEETVVNLLEDSPVTRRVLQARSGHRSLVPCSGIYETLPLLSIDEGRVAGKTYPKAQAMLALKAFPQGDGRVRLELLPELHYGEVRQTWVGSQGAFRLDAGQSKKVFEELAMTHTLASGEMLLLTNLPGRPGSLGHHFFTHRTGDTLEQKLLLVRILQTQFNDLFGPELLEVPEE